MRTFEELIAEAEAVSVDGWDFSWLDGRATEERPSWGYQRLLAERLGAATSALDIQTGGGEVLAGALRLAEARGQAGGAHGHAEGAQGRRPTVLAATESWPPNLARATRLLNPLGAVVVADPDEPPLPFADEAFELVSSRHPVRAWWAEIARVLRPGGSYFAQHVGPASVFELVEYFLGPQPQAREGRRPEAESAEAREAGLEVVDLRSERLRMEFRDIGAVVYFLRKVIWMVPGFTVAAHLDRLRELDARIRAEGPFVAHSARFLIEARKP
ncbi:methyltransferase family protein [Streptomyces sp. 1114.5]|uniref:methyltransferase domain-containing protein n=1 Tax=Streptomyces sp. 1114.5 TaxID=1938830 RepID=UPI000EB58DCB|nr:methyltransferase domain-containing protein [Streptomyces sp. 1114.5]RKT08761.1 methyltransferase family protein [Streptomyces sp. 1114.5]